MTMQEFIDEHRGEIADGIRRATGQNTQPDDEEIEQWIENDEGLYNWAEESGVDV